MWVGIQYLPRFAALPVFLCAVLCFVVVGGPVAFATLESAPVADESEAVPRVLSTADAETYRRIFALGESSDWKAVDTLIARLENPVLVGHALAQRYLHPTKYRSRYKELKAWMAAYADHPDARRIYKLALRRKPRNWRSPQPPESAGNTLLQREVAARQSLAIPGKRRSAEDRSAARQIRRQVRRHLRNGWTKAAKQLIRAERTQRVLSRAELDEARARLSFGYFVDGRDEWAIDWTAKALKRSARYLPEAHWTSGLAAWRLGRYTDAAAHFGAVAERDDISSWMVSAAAFWAARANLVARRPERVNTWLASAAAHPRTFYGLLARRVLGLPTAMRWEAPPPERAAMASLTASPTGRRALALVEVGQYRRAERELTRLAGGAGPVLARGIMAFAGRVGLPELAIRLDALFYPDAGGFDSAAYPLPRWQPAGGFGVDRALIYALVRQESRFNPKAKSPAGARGLMQLMPRTASFVARDRRLHGTERHRLFDPSTNLDLGQRYIRMLLSDAAIGGDLFMLAAAWNGGPGNLSKWRRRSDHLNDPLFFIECLPSRETRIFIERVLANLWIYRDRLDQPSPSLDALATGAWPIYTGLDADTVEVVRHGED